MLIIEGDDVFFQIFFFWSVKAGTNSVRIMDVLRQIDFL